MYVCTIGWDSLVFVRLLGGGVLLRLASVTMYSRGLCVSLLLV